MTTREELRSATRGALGRIADGLRLIVGPLGGHHPRPIPVRVSARRHHPTRRPR